MVPMSIKTSRLLSHRSMFCASHRTVVMAVAKSWKNSTEEGAHKTKGGRRTADTTVAHLRTMPCPPLLPQEHVCASHHAVVMAVAKAWKELDLSFFFFSRHASTPPVKDKPVAGRGH